MKLVPREETKAHEFVLENPDYNGKDVIIGILDTGVDPGAIGLSSLPGGDLSSCKLIDSYDCTGSGDVLMSTEVNATFLEDKNCWSVKGLSGKTLYLSHTCNLQPFPVSNVPKQTSNNGEVKDNDSKEGDSQKEETDTASSNSMKTRPVRLGIKRAYELFPKKLITRVQHNRDKSFHQNQSNCAVAIRQKLQKWHDTHPDANTATPQQIAEKKDLEAQLSIFESSDSANLDSLFLSDPGPIYDCVLYFDGTHYRALIDTNPDQGVNDGILESDLTAKAALTNYRDCEKIGVPRYQSFGTIEMFNYSINIFDDGKVLSIVCDAGAHGSHVAGITSAYFPTESTTETNTSEDDVEFQQNGVAPGAKLISFKIGDTRLGSMETGSGLIRALILAIELKCDVINLSYGEAIALPNRGRFVELAERLVQQYGITFVSSAGNNGPAITTVGAPGGTSTSPISVGAYVSPAMMTKLYSQIPQNLNSTDENKDVLGTTYTWSSLGPAPDGGTGVDIIAPGGAITSVPNWTLQKNQLMNGTSMSSPHVAGCVALLLSAAKASGISTNPNRLKRAIVNTAQPESHLDYCQQGSGMINVQRAWEYLKEFRDDDTEDVFFDVSISNRPNNPRGIYLRQPNEACTRQTFSVFIDPKTAHHDSPVDDSSQQKKINFEMRFRLRSTQSWITIPSDFFLMNNGRSFNVIVDPTNLSPGLHTAQIFAYAHDENYSTNVNRGPMFVIPVTIARPMKEQNHICVRNLQFQPAEVKRHFLSVPLTATWMDVTLRRIENEDEEKSSDSSPRMIALHTLQLLPHTPYRDEEKQKYFSLTPGQVVVTSIPVHGGVTCELALARYWSTIGDTTIDLDVTFHGVLPNPGQLTITTGGGGAKVFLQNYLEEQVTLNPEVKLTTWKTSILPSSHGQISPLGERDIFPVYQNKAAREGKQIYQILLTYQFEQKEDIGSIRIRVPSLQGYLYESEFESQLIQVYDENKKLLGVCDSWPGSIQVPKGTKITIQLQARHDDVQILERLKSQEIWVERKLQGKEIPLSVFSSHENMVKGKDTFSAQKLTKGVPAVVFVAEPMKSKIPEGCKCGDILEGYIKYSKKGVGKSGDGNKPGGFKVKYIIGCTAEITDVSKAKGKVPEPEDKRSDLEKLSEAINKLKVSELEKLAKDKKAKDRFLEMYNTIQKDFVSASDNDNLSLLMVKLKHEDDKTNGDTRLVEVVNTANSIIDLIDKNVLAVHYSGTGFYDEEDPVACKERKEMDGRKKNLIEALSRKALALADFDKEESPVTETNGDFERTLKELKKWVDIDSDMKFAELVLARERRAKRFGETIKLLNKLIKSKGEDTKDGIYPLSLSDVFERRADILKEMGSNHLVENDRKWRLICNPKEYALF